jgi:hypothetical protein
MMNGTTQPALSIDNAAPPKQKRAAPQRMETVSYAVFENAVSKTGMPASVLARELGYSDTTASNWKKDGRVPKVVGVACEGLIRRRQISPDASFVVVMEFKGAVPVGTRTVNNPDRVTILGRKFLLIPADDK